MVAGKQVGAYRILEQIGEGGMAEVWLAEHTLLERRAAIKLLHSTFSTQADVVSRFFNEARAATAIADPGIVQIFDFGYHTDGTAYIVMELLEGETLGARLRKRGTLAVGDALRIMRQVASSLGAAHASGAVYVFTSTGATWTQQAYVKASDSRPFINFGSSVALSADGSTLAVGAKSSGEVYVLTRAGNTWTQQAFVEASLRDDTTWTQQAYIKASNTGAGDQFGTVVALSADGSALAVGAKFEGSAATGVDGDQADNSAPESGAFYLFRTEDPDWVQQDYVKASNTGAGDHFGSSIALSAAGSIAVGAVDEDSASKGVNVNQNNDLAMNSGAVYVFQ